MKMQTKSLLASLMVGVALTAPAWAQDVQSGLRDLEAERYPKAEQTFKQLASSSPNAENQFYLGYYYLRANQPDLAKAAFEKGLAADPKNQLNNVGLGAVALAKKDRATAKAKIDEAVNATKSKNLDVLLRAGEAYTLFEGDRGLNDPAEAVRLLELAKKLDKKGTNIEIPLAMGDAYMIKNDGGQAINRYEDALLIQPNLAEANYKIGRIWLRGRQYKNAQEYFEKAIANDADFAPTYRVYADALANSRAYKKASGIYNTYVQKSGTQDAELLLDVARYYFLAGDYLQATNYLDQIKGRINNPITDRMYGWAYAALGKNDQAVESLNKFISSAPQKVIYDDYKYLGRAYGQLGTPEGDSLAVVNLDKAAPSDTLENLYQEIGERYFTAKRYDRAADYYVKGLARDKTPSSNDYLKLGLANYQYAFQIPRVIADTAQQRVLKQQYFMRADSAFGKVAEMVEKDSKTYPLAYYYRGQSNYYALPREQALASGSAVPFYEKFIEQANAEADPAKKQTYSKYLVTAYKYLISNSLAKKDDVKAREYATKVLELDPNDKDAKQFLEGPKTPPAPAAPARPKAPVKRAGK